MSSFELSSISRPDVQAHPIGVAVCCGLFEDILEFGVRPNPRDEVFELSVCEKIGSRWSVESFIDNGNIVVHVFP